MSFHGSTSCSNEDCNDLYYLTHSNADPANMLTYDGSVNKGGVGFSGSGKCIFMRGNLVSRIYIEVVEIKV